MEANSELKMIRKEDDVGEMLSAAKELNPI
jgi:hypothetical protein